MLSGMGCESDNDRNDEDDAQVHFYSSDEEDGPSIGLEVLNSSALGRRDGALDQLQNTTLGVQRTRTSNVGRPVTKPEDVPQETWDAVPPAERAAFKKRLNDAKPKKRGRPSNIESLSKICKRNTGDIRQSMLQRTDGDNDVSFIIQPVHCYRNLEELANNKLFSTLCTSPP
jgi:hypothetical protein